MGRSFAAELRAQKVRITTFCPGPISTDIMGAGTANPDYMDPDALAQLLVAIAALHLIAGRRNQARTHLQAALELDAENPEALINLALLDYQDGDSEKALVRLDRILARSPSPQAERLRAEIRRHEAP